MFPAFFKKHKRFTTYSGEKSVIDGSRIKKEEMNERYAKQGSQVDLRISLTLLHGVKLNFSLLHKFSVFENELAWTPRCNWQILQMDRSPPIIIHLWC